ncbi:MAG: hypothetical protein ABSC03_07400 [Verrucomicrobiota bacterium]|jgi:hypothetical protein
MNRLRNLLIINKTSASGESLGSAHAVWRWLGREGEVKGRQLPNQVITLIYAFKPANPTL